MRETQQTTVQEEVKFQRIEAHYEQGLSAAEAELRMEAGAHNAPPQGITPTAGQIVLKNCLTLFNLINLVLAVAILLVGRPENVLFFGVAICNTAMGIFQELRAKRTLDKLSVLAQGQVTAVRDGQRVTLPQDQVVLDDILLLESGQQVCADGVILRSGGFECDESLLTGEGNTVPKKVGKRVLSGSIVTAGKAYIRVTAVGADSYANALTVEARRQKKPKAPMMQTLNRIIQVLAVAIIPIGGLLFWRQYTVGGDIRSAVLGASAAMIGMIPEGLILLTGVTLTVGAMRLAGKKALVQSLPSIETLARVDVLCLDKTGTITDGTIRFEGLLPHEGQEEDKVRSAIRETVAAIGDTNATAEALRAEFGETATWNAVDCVPFSSARKWSGACFAKNGSYVLGAPGFVLPGDEKLLAEAAKHAADGLRVLCLAHAPGPFLNGSLPAALMPIALILLSDTVRPEAAQTFRTFREEGVTLKVISGDDVLTVSHVARRAGIEDTDNYIDMSTVAPEADYAAISERYTVFGRVTPEQKRGLIRGLQENGHTSCMTGDGVNDVLAMKEASSSVAMINGSDAARGAADFVLMTSDFSALVQVLGEGRRVINNIENVASMYLVKTIYSALLSLLYLFLPFPYPFIPLQMMPINALTVGVPSFFLALRQNEQKPQGRFVANILENSLPAALVVVLSVLFCQFAGISFGLETLEISSMNVLLTGLVGFGVLVRVGRPFQSWEWVLVGALMAAFLACLYPLGGVFSIVGLLSRNAFFYLPIAYIGHRLLRELRRFVKWAERRIDQRSQTT